MKERLRFEDIYSAHERIGPYIYETPLEKSIYLSNPKHNVYLKLECHQTIKSFKIRGALNKILQLSDREKSIGAAAVSSGNHGIAVAYVTKLLHMKKAIVIIPENTPESKIDKIKYYGGEVILMGQSFDEAYLLGKEYIDSKGYTFIDGWDNDSDVYAGQGTAGLEILKQNPDIDTILVPIGGGGLCTGTAVAAKGIKPDIKVIGLYSEACTA